MYEKFDPALIEEIKKSNPALDDKEGKEKEGEEGAAKDAAAGPEGKAEGAAGDDKKDKQVDQGDPPADGAEKAKLTGQGGPAEAPPSGGAAPATTGGAAAGDATAKGEGASDAGAAAGAAPEAKTTSAAAPTTGKPDGEANKPADAAGEKAQAEAGTKSAETAPVEATQQGTLANAGENPAEGKGKEESEKSKFAAGDPPGDWQGRIVKSTPADGDDAGHTYHLLDDGNVVAASVPSAAPAAPGGKLKEPEILAWRQQFEMKLGNKLAGNPEGDAVAIEMLKKCEAYLDEKLKASGIEPAMKDYKEKKKALLDKFRTGADTVWAGRLAAEFDTMEMFEAFKKPLKEGAQNQAGIREKIWFIGSFFENVMAKDLVGPEMIANANDIAKKAGFAVEAIDSLVQKSVKAFQAKEGNAGKSKKDMNAWDDMAGMYGDVSVQEQGRTRHKMPADKKKDGGMSTMTVAEFEKTGGALSANELELIKDGPGFMQKVAAYKKQGMSEEAAVQKAISESPLPWGEGAKSFETDVDDKVKKEAPNMPQMAGTSGTTARAFQLAQLMGVGNLNGLRTAMLGALLPIRAHSFQEVVRAAEQHGAGGVPMKGTIEDYKIPPIADQVPSLDEKYAEVLASEKALGRG
ncbi:MAG: hypothetical protein IT382_00845 [Deltaproteobacteria bacterium]|nr:hypothetical protein [Deltaproteobacteria bacterium]